MNILVTGVAGYIGSFMARRLLDDGHTVIGIDNLSNGNRNALDPRIKFHEIDLQSKESVDQLLSSVQIDAVIHFAASISVAESMDNPELYFKNNTFVMLQLLELFNKYGIKKVIFSSTAAVYGSPQIVPIPEDHIKLPTNPYGQSKLMSEQILSWYEKVHGVNFVVLRYFNASGAALDGSMGEAHKQEIHIIPCAIKALLNGDSFSLYGNDYETKDGSCVRDYIHVLDLVEAHVLALQKLQGEKGGYYYNVGTGEGYSNKEVVETVKKISGREFEVVVKERRKGDPAILIADPKKIKEDLGFSPKYSDLETIVKSAWEWHKKQGA